jgi:hypothetical protein
MVVEFLPMANPEGVLFGRETPRILGVLAQPCVDAGLPLFVFSALLRASNFMIGGP